MSEVRAFLEGPQRERIGRATRARAARASASFCLPAGLLADLPAARARRVRPHGRRAPGLGWGRQACVAAALAGALAVASWLALALPVVTLLAAAGGRARPSCCAGARRANGELRELERAWSGALDQLADALEAGLGFPAAAAFVAASGPAPLRPRFGALVERVRRGELEQALEELAAAPEQAARTASALLRAALVELPTGGLAPLLRELARVGRERFESAERSRGRSLALRREATILAASPVCFLALIGWSSPGYLAAYRSAGGTIVSLAGALAIGACYLAMLRLGRIPEPGRAVAAVSDRRSPGYCLPSGEEGCWSGRAEGCGAGFSPAEGARDAEAPAAPLRGRASGRASTRGSNEPRARLALAGVGKTLGRFLVDKLAATLCVPAIPALPLAALMGRPPSILLVAPLALAGFFVPDLSLARTLKARRERILLDLPDALSMLALALAAGRSLHQALALAARESGGPLGSDIGAALSLARRDPELDERSALVSVARASGEPNFARFAELLARKESPYVEFLRTQAAQARAEQNRLLEQAADRAYLAMHAPLAPLLTTLVLLVAYGFLHLLDHSI